MNVDSSRSPTVLPSGPCIERRSPTMATSSRASSTIFAEGLGKRSIALVAEHGDDVVGHVMFTTSLLDAPRRLVSVFVLSPLGVLPAWQKRGAGSALIQRGLEILAERAVPVVFLEGSPRYYSRFGFEPGAGQGFRKPSLRIPDAAFQALRLPSFSRG